MTIKKVPIRVAAAILGKTEQFVRCGLKTERLRFGAAVTTNPDSPNPVYNYHISPKLLCEYSGCTLEDIVSVANKIGVNLHTVD